MIDQNVNIKEQAIEIKKLLEKWFGKLPLFEILIDNEQSGYEEICNVFVYFNNILTIDFNITKSYEDDGSDLMVKYINYQFENHILGDTEYSERYSEICGLLEASIKESFGNFKLEFFDHTEDFLETIVVLDPDIYSEYAKEVIEYNINLFEWIHIECLNDKTKKELDYLINAQKFDLI